MLGSGPIDRRIARTDRQRGTTRSSWPCRSRSSPPQPDAFHLAPHRIKRCTFRRLINVEVDNERVYDVECLYPDRKVPIPLGDLDAASPICNACTAPHIFRPDED